jgi:hypothetical protein
MEMHGKARARAHRATVAQELVPLSTLVAELAGGS